MYTENKITAQQVYSAVRDADTFSVKPDNEKYKKYPDYYVIDEEKSVKWNREEVNRLNKEYNEEVKRLEKSLSLKRASAVNLYCKYIAQELNVSKEIAELIFEYLSKQHSNTLYTKFFVENNLHYHLDFFAKLIKNNYKDDLNEK